MITELFGLHSAYELGAHLLSLFKASTSSSQPSMVVPNVMMVGDLTIILVITYLLTTFGFRLGQRAPKKCSWYASIGSGLLLGLVGGYVHTLSFTQGWIHTLRSMLVGTTIGWNLHSLSSSSTSKSK